METWGVNAKRVLLFTVVYIVTPLQRLKLKPTLPKKFPKNFSGNFLAKPN